MNSVKLPHIPCPVTGMHAVLDFYAKTLGDKPAIVFMADGTTLAEQVTYAELSQQALALADAFELQGLSRGARVVLMLDSSIDYARAFFACLYLGLIAVPLFPPASRKPRHLQRLARVVMDASPALLLVTEAAHALVGEMMEGTQTDIAIRTLKSFHLDNAPLTTGTSNGDVAVSEPDTIAFLQYTSGSTGTPKGVVVRQANLLANLELMRCAYDFTQVDVMANWLPLYHDMGLIGGLLEPLYCGMTCYLSAPHTFARAPRSWLQIISRFGVTASFAPNFAYALCARSIADESLGDLDLSRWTRAINGAEPIHKSTLDAFCERFAKAGFKPEAMSPGYGQAEATLCVTATPKLAGPGYIHLCNRALARGRVNLAQEGEPDTTVFISSGIPQAGHAVRIVNPDTFAPCASDEIGEIWLSGPSNAAAYWNNPEATETNFCARISGEDEPYLRSGDLGFLHNGQLIICARLKDLIILNGRNIYPQDLEFALAEGGIGLRSGRVAAFALGDPESGREQLIVIAEPQQKHTHPDTHAQLFEESRKIVLDALDCAIDRLVLVKPGSIPMTTSGKISRQAGRQQLLADELIIIGDSLFVAEQTTSPLVHVSHGRDTTVDWLLKQIENLQPQVQARADLSPLAHGLDSIALLSLQAHVHGRFGHLLPFDTLFGTQSVWQISQLLNRTADIERNVSETTDRSVAPLSYATQSDVTQSDVTQSGVTQSGVTQSGVTQSGVTQSGVTQASAPQSFAQQRLWFMDRANPGSSQHNLSLRIQLFGPVDAARLRRCLELAVRKHPALRTRYCDTPEGAIQIVEDAVELDWQLFHAAEDSSILAERWRTRGFNLETGPVLRSYLLALPDCQYEWVIVVHHIAFDARSAEILLGEIAQDYTNATLCDDPADAIRSDAPTNPTFSDDPVNATPTRDLATQITAATNQAAVGFSYARFAMWERAVLSAEKIHSELDFWRSYLKEIPTLVPLPSISETSPDHNAGQKHLRCAIEAPAWNELQTWAWEQVATPYMALLTLFSLAVRRLSGQDKFIVGTDVLGRHNPEYAQTLGFFINQLPLRCVLDRTLTLDEMLSVIKADSQAAYAHQELPFDQLVSGLKPARTKGRNPLIQLKLNFRHQAFDDLQLGEARIKSIDVEQEPGDYDLVLDLVSHNNALEGKALKSTAVDCTFEYRSNAFHSGDIARLAKLWQKLTAQISALRSLSLAEIDVQIDLWQAEIELQAQPNPREQLARIARRRLTTADS